MYLEHEEGEVYEEVLCEEGRHRIQVSWVFRADISKNTLKRSEERNMIWFCRKNATLGYILVGSTEQI